MFIDRQSLLPLGFVQPPPSSGHSEVICLNDRRPHEVQFIDGGLLQRLGVHISLFYIRYAT